MRHLRHLHLQCVRFTKLQPFRAFLAQNLRSFVMKHCMGPAMSLRYLSLIIALSSAPNLNHLELVRVPLPGGLFQRAVEDSHGHNGFINLRTLVISGCKGVLEVDLGHLMIVASKKLETLYIQPSLTKDSLFVSLSYAHCTFPSLRHLHLGYIDSLNYSGEWSNDALLSLGLAEIPDTPSSITDSGMKVISQLLPNIKSLSVSNCPHLMTMYHWMPGPVADGNGWSALTDLTLQKCHCLQLSSFTIFVSVLRNIQVIILYEMFKEPPKGCSHVGLSAGTGLGMSSAVVSNQDEHIAVQGHPVQDFDHPVEDEMEEIELELMDPDNEDNQEPHFMVLRGDFFEEDDDIDYMEYENRCINETLRRQHRGYVSDDSSESWYDDDDQDPDRVYVDCAPAEPQASTSGNSTNNNTSASVSSKSVGIQAGCSKSNKATNVDLSDKENSSHTKASYTNSDSTYAYDPHQPSTSKAGMHLDFSYSEPSNLSDSELNTNKLKTLPASNAQKPSQFMETSEVASTESYSSIIESLSMEANSSTDLVHEYGPSGTQDYSIASNKEEVMKCDDRSNASSVNENLITKPCFVLVTKIKDEIFTNKTCLSEFTVDDKFNRPKKELLPNSRKSQAASSRKSQIDSDHNQSKGTSSDPWESKVSICHQSTVSNEDRNKSEFSAEIQPGNSSNIACRNGELNTLKHEDISKYNSCYVRVERLKSETASGIVPSNFIEFQENYHSMPAIDKSPKSVSHDITLDNNLKGLSNKTIYKPPLITQCSTGKYEFENENHEQNKTNKKKVQHDSNETLSLASTSNSDKIKLPLAIHKIENKIQNTCQYKSRPKYLFENSKHQQCKVSKVCSADEEQSWESSQSVEDNSSINVKEENCQIMPCCVLLNKIENEIKFITPSEANSDHVFEAKPEEEISCSLEDSSAIFDIRQSSFTCYPPIEQPYLNNSYDPSQPSTSKAIFSCDTKLKLPKSPGDVESLSVRKKNKSLNRPYNYKNMSTQSSFDVACNPPCTKNCYVKIERLQSKSSYSPLDSEIAKIKEIDCSDIKIPVNIKTEPFSPPPSEINFESLPVWKSDYSNELSPSKCSGTRTYANSNFCDAVTSSFECPTHYYNPVTGNCCKITTCNVVLTKIDDQKSNCESTLTDVKSEVSTTVMPNMATTIPPYFNHNMPSTSKTCNFNYNTDPCSSNSYGKESSLKSDETVCTLRSGTKISSQKKCLKRTNASKDFNCKKIKQENVDASVEYSNKNAKNTEDYDSFARSSSTAQERINVQIEQIKINCDDAAIILKNQYTYLDERFVLNPNPSSEVSVKIEPGTVPCTAPNASCNDIKTADFKPKTIVKSEPNVLDKRTIPVSSKKDVRSIKKNYSSSKSNHKSLKRKHSNSKSVDAPKLASKGSCKKCLSTPVISLVSQGTQANSADIRRSVRRIRRVVAQARKGTTSSKQTSFKSSKISAKKIIKKPKSNHHPDTQDKATSTSDPLLEDDAVQVLKITSDTLLSFTIIACGVSDLTIEDCPKLFHLEVQACRILKKFHLSSCSDLQRFNISQCPKLTIQQLVNPIMSIHRPDSYLLVSYEPCMQSYYPGEGERIILSNTPKDETLVVCHDFQEPSNEYIQAKMKDKMMEWLQYLSTAYATLNYTQDDKNKKINYFPQKSLHYPFEHDVSKIHGDYIHSSKSEFCHAVGRFQLLSNNPIFCEAFETHKLNKEFPSFSDCEATRNNSLFSKEAVDRHLQMNGIVGFYIPITEYNRIETYKLAQPD